MSQAAPELLILLPQTPEHCQSHLIPLVGNGGADVRSCGMLCLRTELGEGISYIWINLFVYSDSHTFTLSVHSSTFHNIQKVGTVQMPIDG